MWEGPEAGTVAQLASLPLLFMLLGPGTSTAAVTKWQFFLRKRNPPVYMRLASVLLVAAWAVLPGPTAGERTVNNVIKKTKENEKKNPPVCMQLTSVLLVAAVAWVVLFKFLEPTAGERTVNNDKKKQMKMKKTHLFVCGQ